MKSLIRDKSLPAWLNGLLHFWLVSFNMEIFCEYIDKFTYSTYWWTQDFLSLWSEEQKFRFFMQYFSACIYIKFSYYLALPLSLTSMAVTGGLIYNGKEETLKLSVPNNRISSSIVHQSFRGLNLNIFPCRHLESIKALWTIPQTSRWVLNHFFGFKCFVGSNIIIFFPLVAGILGFIVGRMSYASTCRSKFQKIGIEGPGFGPWGGGPPFWRGGQGHRWGKH